MVERSTILSSSPRSSQTPRHLGQLSISMPWRSVSGLRTAAPTAGATARHDHRGHRKGRPVDGLTPFSSRRAMITGSRGSIVSRGFGNLCAPSGTRHESDRRRRGLLPLGDLATFDGRCRRDDPCHAARLRTLQRVVRLTTDDCPPGLRQFVPFPLKIQRGSRAKGINAKG